MNMVIIPAHYIVRSTAIDVRAGDGAVAGYVSGSGCIPGLSAPRNNRRYADPNTHAIELTRSFKATN